MYIFTEGHVVCRRSRDCFYGGAVAGGGGSVGREGDMELQQQPGKFK